MKKVYIVFVFLVWGNLMFPQELLITDFIDDLYSYAAIGYKSKADKRYFHQGSIAYFSEAQKKLRGKRVIGAKENEKGYIQNSNYYCPFNFDRM